MFKEYVREIKEEVEGSNIRLSSNDDVEYAVTVIDALLDKIENICHSPKNPPRIPNDKPFS